MYSNTNSEMKNLQNPKMIGLLNKLVQEKVIISERVYKAMSLVDRGEFCDSYNIYEDRY